MQIWLLSNPVTYSQNEYQQQYFYLIFQMCWKGKFGSVYLFKSNSKNYVIKNIGCDEKSNQQLNRALIQVFATKLCSVLQVGPKFFNQWGYDAIVFKDSVQFTMQFCEQVCENNIQKMRKDLLKSLKLLHTFNICHMDIKRDNIGWSQQFSKYVMMDYGFARCLKQPLGEKSLTFYKGTFKYCSPEMKKIYYLNTNSLVDLYYNDFYSLSLFLSEVASAKKEQQALQLSFQENNNQAHHQIMDTETIQVGYNSYYLITIESIESYFLFRFYQFTDNIDAILQIVQKQVVLETFEKLVRAQIRKQSSIKKPVEKLQQCKLLIKEHIKIKKQISQLDALLLGYTFNSSLGKNAPPALQKIIKIIQTPNSYIILNDLWMDQNFVDQVFNFLDVYTPQPFIPSGQREKLIISVHRLLFQLIESKSLLQKVRDVYLYFFEYFQKKGNLAGMRRVQCYFIMLHDMFNQTTMQVIILQNLLNSQQQSIIQKAKSNLEFFLGKIILREYLNWVDQNNYQQNLQKLIERANCEIQVSFIKKTMQIIKMVEQRNQNLFCYRESNFAYFTDLIKDYIETQKYFLGSDLCNMLSHYFNAQNVYSKEQNVEKIISAKLGSQYLRCCMSKLKLYTSISVSDFWTLQQQLSNEPFCKQFPVFHNVFKLSLAQKQRQIICQGYALIFAKTSFHLTEEDLNQMRQWLGRQKYAIFLKEYLGKIDEVLAIENFFPLIESVYKVLTSLVLILRYYQFSPLFLYSRGHSESTNKNHYTQLIDKIEFILSQLKKNCDQPDSFENNYTFQINQSLLLMAKYKWKDAAELLLKLSLRYSRTNQITFLTRIYSSAQIASDMKKIIQNRLYDYLQMIFAYNKTYLLLILPELFPQLISRFYVEKGLVQTYSALKEFYRMIDEEKKFTLYKASFRILNNFAESITETDKMIFIQRFANEQRLTNFQKYFILLPMVLKIVSQVQLDIINTKIYKRIITFCCYYAQSFRQGIFRPFKTILYHLSSQMNVKLRSERRLDRNHRNRVYLQQKVNHLKRKAFKIKDWKVNLVIQLIVQRLKIYLRQVPPKQRLLVY